MGFVKHLELKKQKRRAYKEYNKRAQSMGGYSGALGGGGKSWFSKGASSLAQSIPQFSGVTLSRRVRVMGINPTRIKISGHRSYRIRVVLGSSLTKEFPAILVERTI